MHTRRCAAVALAALLALLSAACGAAAHEADKPAAQILTDARAAADAADSVHITGTVTRGQDQARIDLLLTATGDGREKIVGAGQDIDLIKVGTTLWIKGVAAPGAAPPGYQRLSVQDPRATQLAAQLDKKAVFAQLIRDGDQPTTAGTATVAGQQAVRITPGDGSGVLAVADDAEHPYPLQVQSAGATAGPGGTLEFTEWNAHAVISPPSNGGN